MRTVNWLGCLCAAALAGCSLYPIPDDVMFLNTEDIVRHSRCEIRFAVIDYIARRYNVPPPIEKNVIKLMTEVPKKAKDKRFRDDPDVQYLDRMADVAIVYTFDFNIKENNKADGNAAFKLPFTPPKLLDVGASASLNLTRQGQRQFSAGDRWGDLIEDESKNCKDVWPQRQNIVYPLDGSIGVGRVVGTFIDISNQGGAKDSFVDTLIFTTEIGAGANAAVKLEPVPHSFRLVAASAGLNASRLDVHKMIVSLAFPRPPKIDPFGGVKRTPGDLAAPFQRPAAWRARYNLCVVDARAREDKFNMLRMEPPEVYCITYADSFAPQYGPPTRQQPLVVTLTQPAASQPAAPSQPGSPESAAPEPPGSKSLPRQRRQPAPTFTVPEVRPNSFPTR